MEIKGTNVFLKLINMVRIRIQINSTRILNPVLIQSVIYITANIYCKSRILSNTV